MQTFKIKWEIELRAETALEAVKEAFKTMQEVGTDCTIFTATDENGKETEIDLSEEVEDKEEDEESVGCGSTGWDDEEGENPASASWSKW